MALAGQAHHLVTGNLSDFPAECRRECGVVSLAQFMKTVRKGNQYPARSRRRTTSGGNLTFCWTDPFIDPFMLCSAFSLLLKQTQSVLEQSRIQTFTMSGHYDIYQELLKFAYRLRPLLHVRFCNIPGPVPR